jgi:hypothetical protein
MRLNVPRHLAAILLASAVAAGCGRDPSTPEARRAKADELIKAMSASLAAAQSLTVDTVEVRTGGTKPPEQLTRRIAVQRPAAAYFKTTGDVTENEAFYDGKHLTFVWHKDKAWARGPMPDTLDKALDFMATEYAVNMAAADLFYSNPYESFVTTDSTGGWVGRETIDGTACHHLAFQAPVVDWELWVAEGPQALPCRLKVTYKQQADTPTSQLTFKGWNLAPTLEADTFAAKVDPGYERLYMVRAPTAEPVAEPSADTPPAPPAEPTKQQ